MELIAKPGQVYVTAFSGDTLFVLDGDQVKASVRFVYDDEALFVEDLRGEGDPEAILAIVRFVQAISEPVLISVDEGPDHDRLVKYYKNFGSTRRATVLQVNNHDAKRISTLENPDALEGKQGD